MRRAGASEGHALLRTASALRWQYASVFLQGVAQLAVLSILARLLEPSDFGVMAASLVVIGLANLGAQLGLTPALIQTAVIDRRTVGATQSLTLLLGLCLALLCYLVAPAIPKVTGIAQTAEFVRVLSVLFPLVAAGAVSEALLQRAMQFGTMARINLASYVLAYGAVGIPLAFAGAGVWALVGAAIAQAATKSVLLQLGRPVPPSIWIRWSSVRPLLRFGGGFTLARLLNFGATQGDNLLIGRLLGDVALGHYSRAYQLMMIVPTYVGQALERVLFPALCSLRESVAERRQLFLTALGFVNALVLPLSVVVALSARDVVAVILGSGWEAVVLPLQVLAVGIGWRTSYKLGDSLAKAAGAVFRRSLREAIYLLLVVGGVLIGSRWGIVGAAAGVLVASFTNYGMAILWSRTLLGLTWRDIAGAHRDGLLLVALTLIGTLGARGAVDLVAPFAWLRLVATGLGAGFVAALGWMLISSSSKSMLLALFGVRASGTATPPKGIGLETSTVTGSSMVANGVNP